MPRHLGSWIRSGRVAALCTSTTCGHTRCVWASCGIGTTFAVAPCATTTRAQALGSETFLCRRPRARPHSLPIPRS
eukprot:5137582-Alexandrium_andersonii.AAC.1